MGGTGLGGIKRISIDGSIWRLMVNGKEVSENKKLGINGVYTSATNNAQFKADNELLYALSNSRQSIDKGIFVPDIFTGQNKLLNSLMSKHYTPQEMIQVNKALANASQEYFKRNRKYKYKTSS